MSDPESFVWRGLTFRLIAQADFVTAYEAGHWRVMSTTWTPDGPRYWNATWSHEYIGEARGLDNVDIRVALENCLEKIFERMNEIDVEIRELSDTVSAKTALRNALVRSILQLVPPRRAEEDQFPPQVYADDRREAP